MTSPGPGDGSLDLGPPARLLEVLMSLRGVDTLRVVLSKSFGLELTLASKRGPFAHQAGSVMTSASEVCRTALFSPGGFERCDAFYRACAASTDAHEGPCHLGLASVTVPVPTDEPLGLVLVASGFSATHLPGCPPVDEAVLVQQLMELDPNLTDAPDLVRRLPIVRGDRVDVVRQILLAAATEIAVAIDERVRRLRRVAGQGEGLFGIVGRSPKMRETFELLEHVMRSEAPVLIVGESGTGKELVARALHAEGPRKGGPFVAQSCAALEEGTLEASLFGHVKGAFSGAGRSEIGLFGAAHKGTLFLDEASEMSPALQTKLLRVLSDGTYLPVGATSPKRADVRLVCATHQDLAELVRRGTFREDLFYRINVISVPLPPLRERSTDLALLVERFLLEVEGAPSKISESAWRCLTHYAWPGNVRELRAEVERWAVVASDASEVRPEHLSRPIREAGGFGAPVPAEVGAPAPVLEPEQPVTLAKAVEDLEKRLLEEGLARTAGNRTRLAKELDISRTTLNERLKRFGLG